MSTVESHHIRPILPGSPRRRWSVGARRALVASLCSTATSVQEQSLDSLVAACNESELVDLVLSEGLAGPAGVRLNELVGHDAAARIATRARLDAVRHLGYLQLLGTLGAALELAGIPWVVLKGPVLNELVYGGSVRCYTDLDFLVSAEHLRLAVRALESVGAVLAESSWQKPIKTARGEVTLFLSGMPLIDLHWHVVLRGAERERFKLPTSDLLDRRCFARLGTVEAWTLDPTDFAAHIALHASCQGAQRLRRLVDIERCVAYRTPEWELLVQRCRDWRIELPVAAMLNCARQVLGAAVPTEVLEELANSRLEMLLIRNLAAWSPAGRLPKGRSVKTGLSRSLRDNSWATTKAFFAETLRTLLALFCTTESGSDEFREPDSVDARCINGFERYVETINDTDRFGHQRTGHVGHLF